VNYLLSVGHFHRHFDTMTSVTKHYLGKFLHLETIWCNANI